MQSRAKELVEAIVSTGYGTISEQMLRETWKYPEEIWNLVVHLCKWSTGK